MIYHEGRTLLREALFASACIYLFENAICVRGYARRVGMEGELREGLCISPGCCPAPFDMSY